MGRNTREEQPAREENTVLSIAQGSQAEESLPNAHAARIQSSAQLAAVERRRTLSLSYFTARNAATNAELPSTLSYFFSHSEACYIYPITGGAYSTSPQLQLHLLLPRLSCNKSNVFLAEAYPSLPSHPPLLHRCFPPFQQVYAGNGYFPLARAPRRRPRLVGRRKRSKRGEGGGEGGFSQVEFHQVCSNVPPSKNDRHLKFKEDMRNSIRGDIRYSHEY